MQAIIQARMGSTRLPGKAMLELAGRTVIERVIERVRQARLVDSIVVATTDTTGDDSFAAFLSDSVGADVFRGSENDVLDRFYRCAQTFPCDAIVRVTADDPLKEPRIIDEAVGYLKADPALDYCSNTLEPTYPEGLDIEVFTFAALERAWNEAKLPSEREHVTPYIWNHPDSFRLRSFRFRENLSAWRWTLDNTADFDFMKAIYAEFAPTGPADFSHEQLIDYLKQHSEVLAINAGTVRNEGYLKSLQKETE